MKAIKQSEAKLHWHETMSTTACTRQAMATANSFCLKRATIECCHMASACQLVDALLLVRDTWYLKQPWHTVEQPNTHLHVAWWPHGKEMIPLSAFQQMMHASPAQFSLYCFTALLERNRRFSRTASDSGCTTAVLLLIGSGKSGSTGSGLSATPLGSGVSGPCSCPCSPACSAL